MVSAPMQNPVHSPVLTCAVLTMRSCSQTWDAAAALAASRSFSTAEWVPSLLTPGSSSHATENSVPYQEFLTGLILTSSTCGKCGALMMTSLIKRITQGHDRVTLEQSKGVRNCQSLQIHILIGSAVFIWKRTSPLFCSILGQKFLAVHDVKGH